MTRITIDRRGPAPASADLLVDGMLLKRQDIAAEVANFPAATPGESWQAAERAMILRYALRRRAERLGIAAVAQADGDGRLETDEDAVLRALLEAELVVPMPTEAAIAAFHAAHPQRFRSPDMADASRVLHAATTHRATAAYLARVMAAADVRRAPAPARSPDEPAIRAFIEGADDERWLAVIGAMNRAEDPAAAAVAVMLAEPAGHSHAR
ncbi:MAG: hypothetical protein NT133_16655 [Alphaproteobacteria bacterium]|nr:hypothetical protein [Alphaproteobacteria bacterium]